MAGPFEQRFREAASTADREFRRVRRRSGGLACALGCTSCCASPFHISEWEAAAVSAAAAKLSQERGAALRRRAVAYLAARSELFARTGFLDSRGALAAEENRLPCPALEGDGCVIYESRPLLCRLFGAPLRHAQLPGRIFACELNYPPGSPIDDPGFEAAQRLSADRRAAVELEFEARGGRRYHEPVTVAHALVEDFRTLLPQDVESAQR